MSSRSWINGDYYRNNVLTGHVLNDERLQHDSDYGGMFQQDRATGHMAAATQKLLADNDVNVIEWPPKGADLSPIENCFGEIQRRAKSQYSDIKTKNDLWEYVSEMVFEADFADFIKKCYDSIPNRWKQVKEKEGGVIEY